MKQICSLPATHAFQISCSTFSSISGASSQILALRKSERSLEKVTTAQTTLQGNFISLAAKHKPAQGSFGIMYTCRYADIDVKYSFSFLLQ